MQKATSQKISIFLSIFFLLAWVYILPPSLSAAGMHELSDNEMAAVYAYGFTTFSFIGDTARVDFNNTSARTWTEVSSIKMGYYSSGWDNDWTNVSLGSSGSDLVARGLFIEAKFSTSGGNLQLDYFRIGTANLTGTVSGSFNSFSGTLDGGATTYSRANLGTTSITSSGGGFYMSLERSGSKMGYTFNWSSATIP